MQGKWLEAHCPLKIDEQKFLFFRNNKKYWNFIYLFSKASLKILFKGNKLASLVATLELKL